MDTCQETEQTRIWTGVFRREYTDRNVYSPAELDAFYGRRYGITSTQLNQRLHGGVPARANTQPFTDLALARKERFRYLENENLDSAFRRGAAGHFNIKEA